MLSPSDSTGTPMRSSIATYRFVMGVRRDTAPSGPASTPVAAAGQDQRQVVVLVAVAVRKAAAVDDHRMVEQRAVAFLGSTSAFEQIGELLRCGSS